MGLGALDQGFDFIEALVQHEGDLAALLPPGEHQIDEHLGGAVEDGRGQRLLRLGRHWAIALFEHALEAQYAVEARGRRGDLAVQFLDRNKNGDERLAVDQQLAPCPVAFNGDVEGQRTA